MNIRLVHIYAFGGPKDHARFSEFRCTKTCSTILGTVHGHDLAILIIAGSATGLLSEEVATQSSIGWRHADCRMITADCNRSDVMKVAQSISADVYGIVISVPIIIANSVSDLIIIGHCCDTYAEQCERTLADASVEITISTFNKSEQLMFVPTFLGDRKDTFHSSMGNLYTELK